MLSRLSIATLPTDCLTVHLTLKLFLGLSVLNFQRQFICQSKFFLSSVVIDTAKAAPFTAPPPHSSLQAIATKHFCTEETHFQLKHSTKPPPHLLGKQKQLFFRSSGVSVNVPTPCQCLLNLYLNWALKWQKITCWVYH